MVAVLKTETIEAFGEDHWPAMAELVNGESGFHPLSVNSSSSACGLFQALPCEKMNCLDWTDVNCQVRFGIGYIKNRYGNPINALAFWHRQRPHWY